uniref:Chordin-like protein 1 n=1 Tax=Phallusia mammillata TaxID=59560 RepID=A0A6F9DA31_9ASCI|nr:chordin-like protein 1 [Phallusia mammillata]
MLSAHSLTHCLEAMCFILGLTLKTSGYPTGVSSCVMNGIVRNNGEMWSPINTGLAKNLCLTCVCKMGNTKCKRCESTAMYGHTASSEGIGVTGQTEKHPNLFSFKVSTNSGGWPTDNENVGSAVPRKNSVCFENGVYHRHGETFSGKNYQQISLDRSVCRQCACVAGETYCRTKLCLPIACPQPDFTDKDCCPVCTDRTMPNFPVQVDGGLQIPKTENRLPGGDIRHPFMQTLTKDSLNPNQFCTFAGKDHRSGDTWKAELPQANKKICIECSCENGEVKCKMPKCDIVRSQETCESPEKNRCCPRCETTHKSLKRVQENNMDNKTSCIAVYQFVNTIGNTSSVDKHNSTEHFDNVLAVHLPTSVRIYNWSINTDLKQREVLTLRQSTYERFAEEKRLRGVFQPIGYTSEYQLRLFQRKEGLWNKRCRRICSVRLRKILKALRLKPTGDECQNTLLKSSTDT